VVAARSSEAFIPYHNTIWRHNPEDHDRTRNRGKTDKRLGLGNCIPEKRSKYKEKLNNLTNNSDNFLHYVIFLGLFNYLSQNEG
jgi:hypothetical protein